MVRDRIEVVEVDLGDTEACQVVIEAAVTRFGGLDVLFNNAGVTVRCPAVETTNEIWEAVLDSNLRSVFTVAGQLCPISCVGGVERSSTTRQSMLYGET